VWWVLLATGLAGLLCTVLGLPGLWLFLSVAVGWKLVQPGAPLSWPALGVAIALAVVAELIEFWVSVRYTTRYGGSRRAGWAALVGGIIGAIVGVPVPVVGSVIGSFVGSFLGALLAEWSAQRHGGRAQRAAWGAVVGRVVATVAKVGLGCGLIVVVLTSAWG
jgi:uncharacterized protein YqgC (DUF456 family)